MFEIFSDTNNFKDKKNLINRNYLDHGMTNKVVRKKDCIKLFLLLDNILELLDLVENKISKDWLISVFFLAKIIKWYEINVVLQIWQQTGWF